MLKGERVVDWIVEIVGRREQGSTSRPLMFPPDSILRGSEVAVSFVGLSVMSSKQSHCPVKRLGSCRYASNSILRRDKTNRQADARVEDE